MNGLTCDADVAAFVEDLYERTEADKRPAFLVAFLAEILIENIQKKLDPEKQRVRAKEVSLKKYEALFIKSGERLGCKFETRPGFSGLNLQSCLAQHFAARTL